MKNPSQFESIVRQAFVSPDYNSLPDLPARIILAIERQKRVRSIWFLSIYSVITALSFVVGVWVWQLAGQAIVDSTFGQLLSLLFSDFSVVIVFWKEYAASLVESIPLVSLTMVGLVILTGLISLYQVVKNTFNLTRRSLSLHHN